MLKDRKILFNDLNEFRSYSDNVKTEQMVFDIRDLPENPFKVDGGNLSLETFKGTYPFRESALNTTLSRLGLAGEAFRNPETSDQILANVFNEMKHMLPNFMIVMLADGAVNSINSIGYKHIPMNEVLDETVEMISSFYRGKMNCEVVASYATTYIKFYTDRKVKFNGKERPLVVTLTNSENGSSAIRYGAFVGRNMLPIMDDLAIMHKKNASIEKVQDELNQLEAVINEAVGRLVLLEGTVLTTPLAAIKKLGKEVGIPEKYRDDVSEQIENAGTSRTFTAADIYEMITESVMSGKESPTIQERYKNNILKLLGVDWERYAK